MTESYLSWTLDGNIRIAVLCLRPVAFEGNIVPGSQSDAAKGTLPKVWFNSDWAEISLQAKSI